MINAKIFTYIEKYSQKIYFKVNDLIFKVLYFTFYAKNKPISNNVLIVVPDRLGDNILRIELIRRYINFFESQNIFFFVVQKKVRL